MRLWDSSSIVPLLVRQRQSDRMRVLYESDPDLVVWWATRTECSSALARLGRAGTLSLEESAAALDRLADLVSDWEETAPSEMLRETARRLLHAHPLRAADALQLAAAHIAAEERPATLEFVCLDGRLAQAAERDGFPVAKVSRG